MTGRSSEGVKQVYIKDRKAWRDWLRKHAATEKSIWLVHDRPAKGGKLTYDDIVEECLCWGWIDSTRKGKDDERAMIYVSRRKKRSTWSKLNKSRLHRLIDSGLMTDVGLRAIEEAKKDGSWTSLDHVETLEVPQDLAQRFSKNKRAREHWEKMAPSKRKQMLYYISSARRTETRMKRVAQVIAGVENGVNPLEYRRPE